MALADRLGTKSTLNRPEGSFAIYKLSALGANIDRLPYSIRVLLENQLRSPFGSDEVALAVSQWQPKPASVEIPLMPARVVLQDFTGVPVVVDLVAMRNAMRDRGGNATIINPVVQTDLVIDHSVQVDQFGSQFSALFNVEKEFERNHERYALLRWAQQAFFNDARHEIARGALIKVIHR